VGCIVEWFRDCIHAVFQLRRSVLYGVVALSAGSCGRTDLGFDSTGSITIVDEGGTRTEPVVDAAVPPPPHEDAAEPPPPPPPECEPSEEVCNGKDDDCNGEVDEVPSIPCPGGGYRFCVAGRMSVCPKRCDTCMPGSRRVCFLSYCKFWASQLCASDGRSFGPCFEQDPPAECRSIAKNKQYSRELEQCCLDNGYCCTDEFDLDGDGNRNEMIGDCEDVVCQ
jgi:hypothetical protein